MKVSRMNMRHGRKVPNTDDIYPSIKKRGLIQSLLVRREDGKWGVVAGRRRLYALRRKVKEIKKPVKESCIILKPGDDAAAIEASLIENVGRVPADEMQELEAYMRLSKAGRTVTEIAETFGITELKVKRVLALAGLNDEIRALYADEKIDVPTIRALTMASGDQQTEWLALYHDESVYTPDGPQVKLWLTGGAKIKTSAALFDLSAYDGTTLSDLFGEDAYFADPDQFWKLQNQAIAEQVAEYEKRGWREVVVLDRGRTFPKWEFSERSMKEGGKVFIQTDNWGRVTTFEGYLSDDDIKKINTILAGAKENPSTDKVANPDKPEMSGPMSEYVALHRFLAIRASLLDHPKVALRLMVAHLVTQSGHWRVDVQGVQPRREATALSGANSDGEKLFSAECADACAALGVKDGAAQLVGVSQRDLTVVSVFARLLKLDDDQVLAILTVAMGETLEAGSEIAEALTHVIPVDMAALWEPDDCFFDLLRDKRVINAMVKEIAGKPAAASCLTETGVAQKQIIRNRIAGVGVRKGDPAWRPRWMKTHPRHYVNARGCSVSRLNGSAKSTITG